MPRRSLPPKDPADEAYADERSLPPQSPASAVAEVLAELRESFCRRPGPNRPGHDQPDHPAHAAAAAALLAAARGDDEEAPDEDAPLLSGGSHPSVHRLSKKSGGTWSPPHVVVKKESGAKQERESQSPLGQRWKRLKTEATKSEARDDDINSAKNVEKRLKEIEARKAKDEAKHRAACERTKKREEAKRLAQAAKDAEVKAKAKAKLSKPKEKAKAKPTKKRVSFDDVVTVALAEEAEEAEDEEEEDEEAEDEEEEEEEEAEEAEEKTESRKPALKRPASKIPALKLPASSQDEKEAEEDEDEEAEEEEEAKDEEEEKEEEEEEEEDEEENEEEAEEAEEEDAGSKAKDDKKKKDPKAEDKEKEKTPPAQGKSKDKSAKQKREVIKEEANSPIEQKNARGRNSEVAARMKWLRAKRNIDDGVPSKTGAFRIPEEWSSYVQTNKGAFKKWFDNGCTFDGLTREEVDTEEHVGTGSSEREWLFSDDVLNQVCKGNKARHAIMIAGLAEAKMVRFHPDMPTRTKKQRRHAKQYHALVKESDAKNATISNLKRKTKTQEEGSPKTRRRLQQQLTESPAKPAKGHKKKSDGEDASKTSKTGDAEGEAEPTGRSKAAIAAAKKKEEIKKAQEAEEKKQKRLADPQERANIFLNQVARSLAELQMASSELKGKAVKIHVPAAFVKEYQSTVDSHKEVLQSSRTHLERSACKDSKLFARRVNSEFLTKAENEISMTKKTLKAWRNCVHVYLNDNDKPKAKGSSGGSGNKTGGGGGGAAA